MTTFTFLGGMFIGCFIGVFIMAVLYMSREEPSSQPRREGNKVTITGTDVVGNVVIERHFNSKHALHEAELAGEFLLLNEGVRDDNLVVQRRRMGNLYVESASQQVFL